MRYRPTKSARNSRTQHIIAALIPALIVTLSISGFVWAQKEVTVVVDGRPHHITTQAATVGEALAEAGVELQAGDVVGPSATADVENGMTVVVRHAVPLTVQLGDEPVQLDVVGETVADALVAAGVDPASVSGVDPEITTPLSDDMTIAVPDVVVRVESRQTEVAAGVKQRKDASLAKGVRRVVDPGRPGKLLSVYRVVVSRGVEGTPVLTAAEVIEAPQPRIIAVGSAPSASSAIAAQITTEPGPREGRRMRVVSTGYSAAEPGLSDTTATGARARRGVVAVDPAVIPLGTRLYIPGYGRAVAADTGGNIHGNRIDLCFDTVAEAIKWGRRTVTIVVLD